jgi:hypothetical protein
MDQKVKQHRFLMYLWLFHTPKKLIQSNLLRPGSGSGPKRPDPTKKVRIRLRNTDADTVLILLRPARGIC